METTWTILRLCISQAFAIYFYIRLIPLKAPRKRNTTLFILGAVIITTINAIFIISLGLAFYINYYLLTLTIPYFMMLLYFAVYKGSKLIFAILTVYVFGSIATINGLYASYIFYGDNNPLVDTIARSLTYIIILPIVIKYVCPMYAKMIKRLNKGWIVLNLALVLSYFIAYFVLFVPDSIFSRPEYFVHGYISILLSLLIYGIIFYLFIEILSKMNIEQDKQLLSTKVRSLTAKTDKMETIVYQDAVTGVNNRYALFTKMNQLIQSNHEFIVVFIDLDNLKTINDSYGHSKGDEYLKQFATTLKHTVIDQGYVYRFAGDEFVCVIEMDIAAFKQTSFEEDVNRTILTSVPFIGMSSGVAYYPNDGSDPDVLITIADQNMYAEKRRKKTR